jgi:hypothetical protein
VISGAPEPAPVPAAPAALPRSVPPTPVARTSFAPPAVAARAVVSDVPASGWRVRTELRVGNPRGHVQIPKGGQPGTTSPGRPTFDEVGVEAAFEPVVDVAWRRGRHVIHGGAGAWILHGSEVLREPLVSHQKSYAAGTDVDSGTELWEAWLAYGHTFSLGRCWTLTPGIGAYLSRIDYSITGAGQTSERAFSTVSPLFEAELAWHLGGGVQLAADVRLVADEWLGFSSPTQVVEVALRAHVDLSPCSRVSFSVGATSIQHHDEQTVPNDYLVEVLPWFALGGEFRF